MNASSEKKKASNHLISNLFFHTSRKKSGQQINVVEC